MKKWKFRLSCLILFGLMLTLYPTEDVRAEETTQTTESQETTVLVKPVSIDYDALWLVVNANGHGTVYYTDKSKKNWSEAVKAADGNYYIDIGWLSSGSNAVINLKGDLNEELVTLTLPAANKTMKAAFQKKTGEITFTNVPEGYTSFEWRIATSYEWHTATFADAAKESSAFRQQIDKLRTAGAKLCIRLPQVKGAVASDGTFSVGSRPGKELKVTISKIGNAPQVKVDGSRLTVSTKNTMEFSLDLGTTWKSAETKMALSAFAPAVLGEDAKDVVVLVRYAQTTKNACSKVQYLEIPAQRSAPKAGSLAGTEVVYSSDEKKCYLTFNLASKTTPYEYTVVKSGTEFNPLKCSWKSVTSTKQISLSNRTVPSGSSIYVRKKTIKAGKTTEFELASAATILPVP